MWGFFIGVKNERNILLRSTQRKGKIIRKIVSRNTQRRNKIEEYYWGRKYVVYKNDKLIYNTYDDEVKIEQEKEAEAGKQIHGPDVLTGFCYKCGKYAKEYGKYCSEVKGYHTED